jgi:hypothetical protein
MSDADPSFDGECMEPPLPPPPLEASVEPGALQKQASSSSSAAVFLPPPHPLPLPQVRRFPVPLSGISLAYRQGIGAETLAALLGVSSGSDHGISADHDSKKAKGSGASASAAAQEEEAGLSSMDADPVNNAAQPSLWSHSVALADGSDGGEDSPYGGGGGGSFMWSDARSGGDNNSSSLPRQEESCHSLLEGMASLASSSLGSSPSSAMSAGVGLGSFTGSSYGSQEHDSSLSGQWRTHTQKENWKDKLGKTKVLQPLPAALPWIAFLDLCFSTADDSIAAPLVSSSLSFLLLTTLCIPLYVCLSSRGKSCKHRRLFLGSYLLESTINSNTEALISPLSFHPMFFFKSSPLFCVLCMRVPLHATRRPPWPILSAFCGSSASRVTT